LFWVGMSQEQGKIIKSVQELQEIVRKAIASLIVMEPFIGILSKMTDIYYVEDSQQVAWTDGKNIFFGSKINELSARDVVHVIAHEAMHIILKHAIRSKQILRKHPELLPEQFYALANIVADAYVHMYLMSTRISPTSYENLVKPSDVKAMFDVDIEDKSFEEALEEIIKRADKIEVKYGVSIDFGDSGNCKSGDSGKNRGVLLNPGSGGDSDGDNDRGNDGDVEKIEREINRRIADAYNAAKSAGNVPEGLERIINELLKPKVDWRTILRKDLPVFFGSRYRYSWKKMSKKQPGLVPGRKIIGKKGDVLVLVDTSGSISEEELHQFIAEVFAIAKTAGRDVLVIPWDADVYEPVKIRHNIDIESVKVKLRGGGGTVIYPALMLAEKHMRPSTRIVILSDWDIFDIDSENVRDWLYKHRSHIYAVTTRLPPPSFLQHAKISF
jgi:predicted metal-dependent peptidase